MTRAGADTSRAPLLSVCIPTFNRAEYLAPALESFVSQIGGGADGAVEIIVCDNASTDRTREVAAEFGERHPYVRYRRNDENIGVELNILGGVRAARGEYVWIFGDDDLITEGALSKLLPRLREGHFDFLMTNKTVMNKDLSVTLLERQNEGERDIAFDGIQGLCCEFGFFTQLGFISTGVFRRLPFLAVDYASYMYTYYPHNGVWLEAFSRSPCLYVADVLVVQRQQNQRVYEKSSYYIMSVYVLRTFKTLAARGALDHGVIERIKEHPLGEEECTLADIVLSNLSKIADEGGLIKESEWQDALEIFLGLKSEAYRKRALEIFSDYVVASAVAQLTDDRGAEVSYHSDEVETVSDEAHTRFGEGKSRYEDGITRGLRANRRVAALRRLFAFYATVVQDWPLRGQAGRRGPRRLAENYRLARTLTERPEELDEIRDAYLSLTSRTPAVVSVAPRLVEADYKGFNVIAYAEKYYGLRRDVGPTDLTRVEEAVLKKYRESGRCVIGDSLAEAKRLIDELPAFEEGGEPAGAKPSRLYNVVERLRKAAR